MGKKNNAIKNIDEKFPTREEILSIVKKVVLTVRKEMEEQYGDLMNLSASYELCKIACETIDKVIREQLPVISVKYYTLKPKRNAWIPSYLWKNKCCAIYISICTNKSNANLWRWTEGNCLPVYDLAILPMLDYLMQYDSNIQSYCIADKNLDIPGCFIEVRNDFKYESQKTFSYRFKQWVEYDLKGFFSDLYRAIFRL